MRRREFITMVGGASATWPLVARAQPTLPVIGWLTASPIEDMRIRIPPFHQGLSQADYVEGQNVTIDARSAESHLDRLPALASEMVQRRVAVILSSSLAATLAAKAATQSIPIVFISSVDPTESSLVTSWNRPGGNITGFDVLGGQLAAKRVQMLHELVPTATVIAVLVNPQSPITETETRSIQAAANILGVRLLIVNATGPDDFETAFTTLEQQRAGAVLVSNDALFLYQSARLVGLAARHAVPTIYWDRTAPRAGGLLSYSTDLNDVYRQAGVYVGRILKGESPADLPVQQVTKVELVINLQTAKALGLAVPTSLLVRADEVIE
jgi:putative ABC transport system substrate-binding protein